MPHFDIAIIKRPAFNLFINLQQKFFFSTKDYQQVIYLTYSVYVFLTPDNSEVSIEGLVSKIIRIAPS